MQIWNANATLLCLLKLLPPLDIMTEEKTFTCRVCGREFKSFQSLEAHMRKHKRKEKDEKKEEEAKEEEVKVFKKEEVTTNAQGSTQLLTMSQLSATPQPTPQLPTITPIANPYLSSFGQIDPQPQRQTKLNMDSVIGFLSMPGVVEIIKWIKDQFTKKEDPISQLAYDQMMDSWRSMYELAKATLANLSMNGVKSYSKGLETYYKEFYKRKAVEDFEKGEEEPQVDPIKTIIDTLTGINERLNNHDEKLSKIDSVDERLSKLEKRLVKKKKTKGEKRSNGVFVEPEKKNEGVFIEEEPKGGIFIDEKEQKGGIFIQ